MVSRYYGFLLSSNHVLIPSNQLAMVEYEVLLMVILPCTEHGKSLMPEVCDKDDGYSTHKKDI